MVFPFVIYSGISVSSKHLFISIANRIWIEVIFLSQNTFMPSWPGVFFRELLRVYRVIFLPQSLLRVLASLF